MTITDDFHRRLAARGYYVSPAYRFLFIIVPGPSQNRAGTINAHGSSSVHSLRSKQIHHNPRLRKGIFLQELLELLPGQASTFSTTVQPLDE